MKILFLPLLIALSLPAFAGLATPSDEKAVLAAEKQYIDGMVKSDPDSVAKVLADDLSYTHSSAKMETKADVLKGITNTVQYTSITVESTKVRQYGKEGTHLRPFEHAAFLEVGFASGGGGPFKALMFGDM